MGTQVISRSNGALYLPNVTWDRLRQGRLFMASLRAEGSVGSRSSESGVEHDYQLLVLCFPPRTTFVVEGTTSARSKKRSVLGGGGHAEITRASFVMVSRVSGMDLMGGPRCTSTGSGLVQRGTRRGSCLVGARGAHLGKQLMPS